MNDQPQKDAISGGHFVHQTSRYKTGAKTTVIDSLVSGSLSSAITTILYQPLELLKTRVQLETRHAPEHKPKVYSVLGRVTRSAQAVVSDHGFRYLWRGTGPSLIRSVPGVGLYYATLGTMQTNLSKSHNRPDGPSQAFCFGLAARSVVSLLLLPVSVVKVRYESGLYDYSSLSKSIRGAYFGQGWVGIAPTILRDSLFSGIYYMLYTSLQAQANGLKHLNDAQTHLGRNFLLGIVSGLIASFITNPLDVIKTRIQVRNQRQTMFQVIILLARERGGLLRFMDGLVLRSLRRTLIASSNWTFYELFLERF